MKKTYLVIALAVALAVLIAAPGICMAQAAEEVENVQKYGRALDVMGMLLIGFGFLMVFVRKYGRSALTATFLVVSVAIPLYLAIDAGGILGGKVSVEVDRLILAEFAAASLLICSGAVLGRLKMHQYILLALLFIPLYMLNEWLVIEGRVIGTFVDTGGSIVIHAFGALFGLGVVMTMTTRKEAEVEINSDFTSDRFSMLGSMVLWVFWPSFCAALVAPNLVPFTAVNTILALCGSTLATYLVSVALRRKISIADIANAALAGGVVIGATCDTANHPTAFVLGILAGALSTFGFAVIQPRLQRLLKAIDTCGVTNLHGWPGLLGGLAAVFIVSGISAGNQLAGIGITIGIALAAGYIIGRIISLLGRIREPYDDAVEFLDVE